MVTYEQALEKARCLKSKINKCNEYEDAYVFVYDTEDSEVQYGGEGPCVIMKDDGTVLPMIRYALIGKADKIIKSFAVEQ